MKINYEVSETPKEYVCSECGASHCKLWREYQTFKPKLFCAPCAAEYEEKDISTLDADGKRISETLHHKTDQIGWCVPAIPDEEEIGFWGYNSATVKGIKWWRSLPNE